MPPASCTRFGRIFRRSFGNRCPLQLSAIHLRSCVAPRFGHYMQSYDVLAKQQSSTERQQRVEVSMLHCRQSILMTLASFTCIPENSRQSIHPVESHPSNYLQ